MGLVRAGSPDLERAALGRCTLLGAMEEHPPPNLWPLEPAAKFTWHLQFLPAFSHDHILREVFLSSLTERLQDLLNITEQVAPDDSRPFG